MGRVYVAVDLETTGLDPQKDTILELGAVRCRDGQVLDTFAQVVNPGCPIPRGIQQLTGISQAEADAAPPLARVAAAFRRFIGDHPLVGHNIGFDAGFLRSHDLYLFNPLLDTWELALILAPGLSSYKLGRLAEHFAMDLEDAHRALADATATMQVFEALRGAPLDLPPEVLQQINQIAARSDWALRDFFAEAERDAALRWSRRPVPASAASDQGPLFGPALALQPVEHPQPLNVATLTAMLQPGGLFANRFAAYEHRPPQVQMLQTVAEAFNHNRHVLVEAGTGTGKSVAYLIPALAWATQTGQRVVVSSNTINLQDQLFQKDLPDLQDLLPFPFRAAVLKGRSNYLCRRRLHALLQRGNLNAAEISVIARILVWLQRTTTGDVNEITLANAAEWAVWQRVCSESNGCAPARCGTGTAHPDFFYRARQQAEVAHVIIINHALLLADIAVEGNVLPAYNHLIIDEAHHLEDATTNALTFRVDYASFAARLRELAPLSETGKGAGLLSDVATAVRNARIPADKTGQILQITQALAADAPLLADRMSACFDAIDRFLWDRQPRGNENNTYDIRQRLTDAERVQPAWVNVEITWDNTALIFKRFNQALAGLCGGLLDLSNYKIEGREDLLADLQGVLQALQETFAVCEAGILKADRNTIYWLQRSQRQGLLALNSAPLHVGDLIERHIFLKKDTVVLTSATLRTANSFDYMRRRLGAGEAEEIALDSPFDYRQAALIYLPTDMPEPNQPGYQARVEEAILHLSLASQGRLLALFTSYTQLKATAEVLRPLLAERGLTLLVQGEGGSRQQILQDFRRSERAVLFGTRSFWEGVDVQGEALSALVICRLPFAVPTDPIVAARSETFDSAFFQYSVPEAILGLRQGFGRLIRANSDRGVCVVLDRRLTSKKYGSLFLESLPACTVQRGPLSALGDAARRWLAGDRPPAPAPAPPSPAAAAAPSLPADPPPPAGSLIFQGYENYMPEPPPPDWWE